MCKVNECNLNGSKMNEIVAGLFGNPESIFPLAERTKTFGEDRLAVNAVNWQHLVIITVCENGIDKKITRTARLRVLADWQEFKTETNVKNGEESKRRMSITNLS